MDITREDWAQSNKLQAYQRMREGDEVGSMRIKCISSPLITSISWDLGTHQNWLVD